MKPDNLDLIGLLRRVMVDATTRLQLSPIEGDVCSAMAKRLHFPRRDDWMVFGACLYTFEDAAMGIRGYFSTCNGVGDRDFEYLRLFGFLNACYLQVGAVERLCAIVNIHGKKTIVGDLRSYELIQCRNMLASHTVAYKVGDSVQSITIEQCSLGRAGATFIINETGERRLCSFRELYSSWAKAVRSALIAIVTKFIKTVFKTNADRRAEHLATLSVLVGAAAEREP